MITIDYRLIFTLLAVTGCARDPKQPVMTMISEERRSVMAGFENWQADFLQDIPHDGEPAGDGSYSLRTGKWVSPRFDVASQAWYRMVYETKSSHSTYCTARSYDGTGTEMDSDNYTGIDRSPNWRPGSLFFMGRPLTRQATVGFEANRVELGVRNVTVESVGREHVLAWMDELYSQLPQVSYTPPTDRWKQLPRTRQALRDGGELRVLLLGDSIANDFSNSHFQLLIERRYPGLSIHLTPSVRGSTGCRYYRHRNRVQEYVIQHRPDLVIILNLGLNDSASILDVITQVRATINCEFLVFTGAMSLPDTSLGHSDHDEWRSRLSGSDALRGLTIRRAEEFCAQTESLRDEHRFSLFNLRGVWEDYLSNCGKPHAWYLRDGLHGNERGKQILARIAEIYFSDGET
jgi:hypothetical protein